MTYFLFSLFLVAGVYIGLDSAGQQNWTLESNEFGRGNSYYHATPYNLDLHFIGSDGSRWVPTGWKQECK